MRSNRVLCCFVWNSVLFIPHAWGQLPAETARLTTHEQSLSIYFQAISSIIERPVIISNKVKALQVTGDFDLTEPMQALRTMSRNMGLIWYFDGHAMYIYRQEELSSSLGHLEHLKVNELIDALKEAGIYDERYPLNPFTDVQTFYLSGPPKYLQLVTQTATLLDKQYQLAKEEHASVAVVNVRFRPVSKRTLTLRGEKQVTPGLADILQTLWAGANRLVVESSKENEQTNEDSLLVKETLSLPAREGEPNGLLWILADAETNSLILRGNAMQINDAKQLIRELDRPKSQVQLSLKVIDVKESEINRLGVDWTGSFQSGSVSSVINPIEGVSALVGTRSIMARINALTAKSQARIISRPMVLTQDNVTAYFDNSHSFYIKLEAERVVDLKTITYGTLISVTPRIIPSAHSVPNVEMQLTVEDGSREPGENSVSSDGQISQTRIETLARVPSGTSLLIGGYTRSERIADQNAVPFISRIPLIGSLFRYERAQGTNVVRLFLIEPVVLKKEESSTIRLEEWLVQLREETSRSFQ